MITKEDFQAWLSEPVTQAFLETVKELEQSTIEQLIANQDREAVLSDDFYKGAITALRDILQTSVEDVQIVD